MKTILVIFLYVAGAGVGGAPSAQVQTITLNSQQECQKVAQAVAEMGGSTIQYRCVDVKLDQEGS